MAKAKCDVVWFWRNQRWNEVLVDQAAPGCPAKSAEEQIEGLTRMGFRAVKGWRSIGPPEGPPRD